MNQELFPPGIDQYLDSIHNTLSVDTSELLELIQNVQRSTGISEDLAKFLVESFFQEIRNAILRGEIVSINGFGKWFIASPLVSGTKKRIFPAFQAHPSFLEKINDF